MQTDPYTQESLLFSSLRSFLKAFFSFLGFSLCLILVAIVLAFIAGASVPTSKSTVEVAADVKGQKNHYMLTAPTILKISIQGMIGAGKLTTEAIEDLLSDSRDGILKNNKIKGILLCIDTPGGSVSDSNGIYEALKLYKERYNLPIYAYVDGLCASGGMYVASSADQIHASPISIIGSVGVIFGPAFNVYQLLENWGVKAKVLSQGKDKEMLNPFTQWKPDEDASLVEITKHLYSEFVTIVSNARPRLDKQKLIDDYGAQVFTAPKAQELGYIDVAGATYSSALEALLAKCDLKKEDRYQVVELLPAQSVLSELINGHSSKVSSSLLEKVFKWADPSSKLNEPFYYLYDPMRL